MGVLLPAGLLLVDFYFAEQPHDLMLLCLLPFDSPEKKNVFKADIPE